MFWFLTMSCLLRINGLPWEFIFPFFGLINIFFLLSVSNVLLLEFSQSNNNKNCLSNYIIEALMALV